ncbi:hypothetical protein [Arthrobacter cryoconiti]|uniref:Alkaline shock response membrane anchor protein AmaP n=1 Tax=Arthrobacter cryoconiti TaxID=748907 RepID=A0ABV8QYL3_9MICC|nr:hypothetical protein [Arthrobacter cryoconiti]MCC9067489.1 hypothetical protein [Arthrobacter cryoconiti]
MNTTPRGFNRFMLGLLGLFMLALGAGLVLLAVVPAAGRWWQSWAEPQVRSLGGFAARTHIATSAGSWVWLVVAAVFVAVVIVSVSWIANQGKGRANVLFVAPGSAEDDGASGKVVLGTAVAEQTLKAALLERTDLLGVSVSTYDFRGQASLRVRVLPRQGVAPQDVATDIRSLVDALDTLLGVEVPVLLSIGSGARTRFTRAERVR